MTTRIPAKEITGPYGVLVKTFSKRMFGRVPERASVIRVRAEDRFCSATVMSPWF